MILKYKTFAFRDYEGLDNTGKRNLRSIRKEKAKELWELRRKTNKDIDTKIRKNPLSAGYLYDNRNRMFGKELGNATKDMNVARGHELSRTATRAKRLAKFNKYAGYTLGAATAAGALYGAKKLNNISNSLDNY